MCVQALPAGFWYKSFYVQLHKARSAHMPLMRFRALSTDGGVGASSEHYWVRTFALHTPLLVCT